MARKKAAPQSPALFDVKTITAPCVPALRAKVNAWRAEDYPGVTATTRRLLNHWFLTDHRLPGGGRFKYHDFQRHAIETLIYLYEVAQVRRQKTLLESFAVRPDLKLLQYDDFARYCVKMATGTGKTKVMALAIVWQYFNATAEARDDFAKTFLVIAPNVIVFERLRTDFAGKSIFRHDPMIPPELDILWDFECYLRGEGERAGSVGALYQTNIQQMHDRPEADDDDEPDVMTAMMGPKPRANTQEVEDFLPRLAERGGPVVVINDEAHHTHDEESEWNKTIRRVHAAVSGGLAAQLDFTATPRHTKGQLFSWTVFDYPLKQAIIDNIVKRPLKGVAKGIAEQPSQMASTRYQAYLTAGVERWKEYRDALAPLGRKPVLFVMMNDTEEADDVGDSLQRQYPSEFGADRLLIIHTNRSGDVAIKDLDAARRVARDVDDGKSPVNCIVSVVMLREGWDVQSVTVIVGLRPFTAKANILPEQTVGRDLRLMFRDDRNGCVERVDIIGNRKFIEFVEQLEKEEDMQLDEFVIGKDKVSIVVIEPMADKADKDIALPELSPILERKKSLADEIAALDVNAFSCPVLPRKEGDKAAREFRYEAHDLITLQKMIERTYTIPAPQTAEEVIGYYARRIAQDVKLPSQFAALVPKVREFLERKAFGGPVDISTPDMVKAIGNNVVQYVTVKTFTAALRDLVVQELEPTLLNVGRSLPETPKFPLVAQDLGGEEVHLQSGSVRQRVGEGVRPVPGSGRRRGALRQAAGALRVRNRVHRPLRQPAVLRAGFRGRDDGRRVLSGRDEGHGGRERGEQGPGGAALVRERNEADREAVGLPESAREGIQADPAEPFRRSDFPGSQIGIGYQRRVSLPACSQPKSKRGRRGETASCVQCPDGQHRLSRTQSRRRAASRLCPARRRALFEAPRLHRVADARSRQ
jgi:type III restriction enzyme